MIVLLRKTSQKNTEDRIKTLTILFLITVALFWPGEANYKINLICHKRYRFIPSGWQKGRAARPRVDKNMWNDENTRWECESAPPHRMVIFTIQKS